MEGKPWARSFIFLDKLLKKNQHFAEDETSCVITDICQVQNKKGPKQKTHRQAGKKKAS